MNIAVLSDLHANARALRAALSTARENGFDELVILGDLLTYGVDVDETLDLVAEAHARGAHVVLGNHDQMYIDLDAGRTEYVDRLPEWIRESVELTRELLRGRELAGLFRWEQRIALDGVDVFHANPFDYGDWTYLSSAADIVRAGHKLRERVGVCGHTHRGGTWRIDGERAEALGENIDEPIDASHILVNAGSIGQPRNTARTSTFARIALGNGRVRSSIETVTYDVAAHLQGIRTSALSENARDKLVSFFA